MKEFLDKNFNLAERIISMNLDQSLSAMDGDSLWTISIKYQKQKNSCSVQIELLITHYTFFCLNYQNFFNKETKICGLVPFYSEGELIRNYILKPIGKSNPNNREQFYKEIDSVRKSIYLLSSIDRRILKNLIENVNLALV